MTILLNRRLNGRPYMLGANSTSANSGGSAAPPMSQSFTLSNYTASASLGFHKRGVWFKKGDVPAGQIPLLDQGVVQFYALRYWSDGSLKTARKLCRFPTFAANESRIYKLTAGAGTYPNGSVAVAGDTSLISALAGHDVRVTFANVVKQQQTGGDAYSPIYSTSAYGSGTFMASLSTHAATTTRWTTLTTGVVADVWQGWGMATDSGTGAADAHLKVNWYVTRWKNADGSTAALQIGAVPSLDWWSVASKFQLNYDASLVDGSLTILSYTSVQHPYQSQWLMAVQTGNNAASAPWIGATQPTLFTSFDRAYLVSTGLCPPLNTANPPAAVAIPTYTPCGAIEHRANIDGTGSYLGRGLIPLMDADFYKRLDAQSFARARVNALAGLGVPYHYRSNRSRQRPGDSAPDTANTPIALKMVPKPASYYDFTAQGLPVPVDAYADSRSPATAQDGFVPAQGGTGVWSTSGDASHGVSYCYFMALVTGDEWLVEAQIDLAMNLAHQGIYGFHNNRQLMLTGTAQQSAATTPATDTNAWTGLLGQWQADNVRSMGWSQLIQGHAWGLIPADHVAFGYSQALLAHNGDYIAGSLSNLPSDYVMAGAYYPPSEIGVPSVLAPWQLAIISTCAYAAYLATEDTRWKRLGDHTFNWTGRNAAAGRFYVWDQYRVIDRPACAGWSATNQLLAAERQPFCSINPDLTGGTTFTLNGGVFWDSVNDAPPPFTSGDLVIATIETQANNRGTLAPSGMAEGQVFYIRDLVNGQSASGNVYAATPAARVSFALAATPTGPALNFGADTVGVNLAWLPQSAANYPVAQSYPYIPLWGNYVPINLAAVMMARQAGNAAATQSMRDATLAFVAAMGPSTYSPYDLVAS